MSRDEAFEKYWEDLYPLANKLLPVDTLKECCRASWLAACAYKDSQPCPDCERLVEALEFAADTCGVECMKNKHPLRSHNEESILRARRALAKHREQRG